MPEQELLPPLEADFSPAPVVCTLIFHVRLELKAQDIPDVQLLPATAPVRQEPSQPSLWLQPPIKEIEMSRTITLSAMVMAAAIATALRELDGLVQEVREDLEQQTFNRKLLQSGRLHDQEISRHAASAVSALALVRS